VQALSTNASCLSLPVVSLTPGAQKASALAGIFFILPSSFSFYAAKEEGLRGKKREKLHEECSYV